MFISNHEIIQRKMIEIGSIRKVSSLVGAALGLVEEVGRHSRRVLALRREMVLSVTSLSQLFFASSGAACWSYKV